MNTKERAEFVQSMNNVVKHLNDENAYMHWITVVPDEAEQADFEDERAEYAKQAEREAQLEAEEADMVYYGGRMVTSEYAEQMERY